MLGYNEKGNTKVQENKEIIYFVTINRKYKEQKRIKIKKLAFNNLIRETLKEK